MKKNAHNHWWLYTNQVYMNSKASHTHTQSMQIKIKIELVLKRIIFYGIFFSHIIPFQSFFFWFEKKKKFLFVFYCQVFEEFRFQIFHWMLQRISNWWRKDRLLFHTWKIHFIRGAFKRLSKEKKICSESRLIKFE